MASCLSKRLTPIWIHLEYDMALSRKQLDELMQLFEGMGFELTLLDPGSMTPAEISEAIREAQEKAERNRLRELGIDPDKNGENSPE